MPQNLWGKQPQRVYWIVVVPFFFHGILLLYQFLQLRQNGTNNFVWSVFDQSPALSSMLFSHTRYLVEHGIKSSMPLFNYTQSAPNIFEVLSFV